MMAELTARMDAHIQELLDELGAEWLTHTDDLTTVDGTGCAMAGLASDGGKATGAFISLPQDEYENVRVAYFVALHEIGHLLLHRSDRGWVSQPWIKTTLAREEYAWRFALAESRYKATRAVWRHIAEAVTTYLEYTDARFKSSDLLVALLTEARKEAA
jgi:hypothetical protein